MTRDVTVAIGPFARQVAKNWHKPIIVLRDNCDPATVIWPSSEYGALVHETGPANDVRLHKVAAALLRAGNRSVVALRHSLQNVRGADPRIFFDRAES